MPIYEYGCEKCGTFEVSQRITDQPLRRCPTCKGKVRKLISNTSFQLKGSGWYVTDYAGKSSDPKSKDQGKGDSASGTTAESADASKPSKDASKDSKDSSGGKSDAKKTEATAA